MFDCVMPAAGASSRMRPSEGGGFKPLLPFGSSTLAETSAAAALGAGCRLLLVVGCRGDEVAALFGSPAYREAREEGMLVVVRNPRWEEGLLGSIQSALPEVETEAFFVAHADMPFLRPEHYAAIAGAWAEGAKGEAPVMRRPFAGAAGNERGHPVLLPSAAIPEIAAFPPGEGLRDYLRGRPPILVDIGPAALHDIDTEADYAAVSGEPRKD